MKPVKVNKWQTKLLVGYFFSLIFVTAVSNQQLAFMVTELGPAVTFSGLLICALVFPFAPSLLLVWGFYRVKKWRDNREKS